FGLLRDRQREHAVVELRVDALAVGDVGQREAARERAVLALVERVALTLRAVLGAAAAADRQDAVVQADVEVLLLDARQVGLDDERVIGLLDLERGRERRHAAIAEQRIPRQQLSGK